MVVPVWRGRATGGTISRAVAPRALDRPLCLPAVSVLQPLTTGLRRREPCKRFGGWYGGATDRVGFDHRLTCTGRFRGEVALKLGAGRRLAPYRIVRRQGGLPCRVTLKRRTLTGRQTLATRALPPYPARGCKPGHRLVAAGQVEIPNDRGRNSASAAIGKPTHRSVPRDKDAGALEGRLRRSDPQDRTRAVRPPIQEPRRSPRSILPPAPIVQTAIGSPPCGACEECASQPVRHFQRPRSFGHVVQVAVVGCAADDQKPRTAPGRVDAQRPTRIGRAREARIGHRASPCILTRVLDAR